MKRYHALPSLLLMMLASGCLNELRDEMTECKISWNNKWAAKAAYNEAGAACQGLSCPHSFKEGFIAGYIAVANGGTGCPPAVPDIPCCNHMWLDRCSDSQKMEAWYDGYELGAQSARETGMSDYNRVTTRIPHAAAVDYNAGSGTATLHDSPTPANTNSALPPAPVSDDSIEVIGGPQTRR